MNKDIKINVAKTLHISPSAFFEGEVKHFGGDGAVSWFIFVGLVGGVVDFSLWCVINDQEELE
jgi:hypothetical protein